MKTPSSLLVVAGAAILFTACGQRNEYVAPPPPEVDVINPKVGDSPIDVEFTGRVVGSSRVEIRARVKGFLDSVEYSAGDYVEAGKVLFKIERDQFDSAVTMRESDLRQAEAALGIAETTFERRKQAAAANAVSELEVADAEASVKGAEAAVQMAKAALDDAKRDLTYTEVKAPIAGRVSDRRVDPGNLVGANEPTLLTEIVATQPVYFEFEVGEREILQFLGELPNSGNSGQGQKKKGRDLTLLLSDGSVFDEVGHFDFLDNTVDPDSGTIRVRALFENKSGFLVDGLFGRIRVPDELENTARVPGNAVQRDLGGAFVLVVNAENVVERRPVVSTGFRRDGEEVLDGYDEETGTGLKAEDRIIVSNLQRAREGIEVVPKAASSDSSEGAGAPVEEPAPAEDTSGEETPEEGEAAPAEAE